MTKRAMKKQNGERMNKWRGAAIIENAFRRREGKRARFASGPARTPLPSRRIRLSASSLFRFAFCSLARSQKTCACWRPERVCESSAKRRHLFLTSTRTTVKQPFWGKIGVKIDSLFRSLFSSKRACVYIGAKRAANAAASSDLSNINTRTAANYEKSVSLHIFRSLNMRAYFQEVL